MTTSVTPAIEAARRLVLDGIAIAIAGTEEEAIHILAAHHKEQGSAPQATAIGNGFRLNTVSAAALNGAAMHVLDFEPMWSPANHALSTTLAGVLALAEHRGATGREVLTALVKGVEMQGWIRQASGQFEASTCRFHPPGAAGPLGAAVAAGHLLKLDPGQLAHAIGIAASRAGSVLANAGTMTKSTHCGHAAALGLEVGIARRARLHRECRRVRSGARLRAGVLRRRLQDRRDARLRPRAVPHRRSRLCDQDVSEPVRHAFRHYRRARTAPANSRHARYSPRGLDRAGDDLRQPAAAKKGLEGKFSLQYTAAAALLDGKVGIRTFTDARLAKADMQELLGKFEVVLDPAIPGRFEDMHVLLRVELDGGRVLETRCNGPRGKWGTPPISEAEHLVKVRDCLATRLDAGYGRKHHRACPPDRRSRCCRRASTHAACRVLCLTKH